MNLSPSQLILYNLFKSFYSIKLLQSSRNSFDLGCKVTVKAIKRFLGEPFLQLFLNIKKYFGFVVFPSINRSIGTDEINFNTPPLEHYLETKSITECTNDDYLQKNCKNNFLKIN